MDSVNEEAYIIQKEFARIFEYSLVCSDNETICSPSLVEEFSKIYEQELDNQLEKYGCLPKQESNIEKKKRGRKLLRPNDPIRKKTEIKDKY